MCQNTCCNWTSAILCMLLILPFIGDIIDDYSESHILAESIPNNTIIITDLNNKVISSILSNKIIDINDEDKLTKILPKVKDVILHTYGGNAKISNIIIKLIYTMPNTLNFYIPRKAYSAGTRLALCGNIYMNDLAQLSPIDYQLNVDNNFILNINTLEKYYDLVDVNMVNEDIYLAYLELLKHERYNHKLMIDILLKQNYNYKVIANVKEELMFGKYPHSYPFNRNELTNMGLRINDIPNNINEIFYYFEKIINK